MGSVSLGVVSQIFKMADIDGNGKLDRPEIAKEAIAAFGSGDTTVGSMLATLVKGGAGGQGLFPDSNGDGQLSFDEMTKFASLGGDPNGITPDDFRAGFGSQATAQGQGIDMNALQSLASQNVSKFSGDFSQNQGMIGYVQNLGSNNYGDTSGASSAAPAFSANGGSALLVLLAALLKK